MASLDRALQLGVFFSTGNFSALASLFSLAQPSLFPHGPQSLSTHPAYPVSPTQELMLLSGFGSGRW